MIQEEQASTTQFLMSEMGLRLKTAVPTTSEVELTEEETYLYMKRFQALDADGKGFITINDLRKHFKVSSHRSRRFSFLLSQYMHTHSSVMLRSAVLVTYPRPMPYTTWYVVFTTEMRSAT